jgi:murein DD-endopeptidase MepM/ murein hydrolase activator NlpD
MRRVCAWVAAFTCLSGAARAQAPAVTLSPAVVVAGSPELVRVRAPQAQAVSGEWMGRKLSFFRGKQAGTWVALAGADVESPLGPSTLRVTAQTSGGELDRSRSVEIHRARYRSEALSVAPEFVQPGPEALEQIAAEKALKQKVFAESAAEPLWSGDFRRPVKARSTDSFGVRRTFNGKLESVHKGMDFRTPTGTPVRAGNSGVVVLAAPLYYEGNCVVIDHGMGLYTIAMHLSRIDVREGQHVNGNDLVGLSGATGRVTGPHLHWAVRWQDAYLDPAKLLRMHLGVLR